MRLEELVLRIPGDEFAVRFHEHLTVLSGIGMLERQALTESLLGALTGSADNTVLTYIDRFGRQVEVVANGGTAACRYLDDDTPALPLVGTIAPTADALRSLVVLQAGDLGLVSNHSRGDEPPELIEARATLTALTKELQHALSLRQNVDRTREELAAVRAQIRMAEDGSARREYAQVLADLERVRAEAAALQSGSSGEETDQHLLDSAGEAREIAEKWQAATARLAELRARADLPRMEPEELAVARWFPDTLPSDLDRLLDTLVDARRERDRLDLRLRDLASAQLPEPSDDRVVELATADQDELWQVCEEVEQTGLTLRQEQLALGGAGSGSDVSDVVEQIEITHSHVEELEALVDRRRVPVVAGASIAAVSSLLLGPFAPLFAGILLVASIAGIIAGLGVPMRRLAVAQRVERRALSNAGVSSHLAFHIRRVEATITPGAHGRLATIEQAHRTACRRWEEIGRGLSVEDARRLEIEVRSYARALRHLGSKATEVESLRRQLFEEAEPAVATAREALVDACATYGVDAAMVDSLDRRGLERLLLEQVEVGAIARLQEELEDAEAVEQKMANRLDDLLHQLGFREGTLEARVGALDWAVDRATERAQARTRARSRREIEDDLVRLQNEARRLRRPEWATVQASDAEGPDFAELTARREELEAALDAAAEPIDLERLSDRHAAMERRVSALEAQVDPAHDTTSIGQLADVQQYLLAHLTKAAHAGPYDESVPVVLDDPFLRIAAERKWELLDMLRRLGEKTQLVYLTDDPFVGAWARRRASAGLITLLEPVEA